MMVLYKEHVEAIDPHFNRYLRIAQSLFDGKAATQKN